MNQKLEIKGLWVPLVTPFSQGSFDSTSLITLLKTIEPFVDGFVPCLSSGEGAKMSDQLWKEVLKTVVQNTKKPTAVGILNLSLEKISEFSQKARELGCVAVVIPLQGESAQKQKNFCKEISDRSALPIILYNTEKVHIHSVDAIEDLSRFENIVAIKDSSQDKRFFNEMILAKREGNVRISILQGMEDQLLESAGCDGYLISLANIEPELCKEMFEAPSPELNKAIMKKWDEYNLASETWYVGIKQALVSRGILASEELIK